MNTSAAIADSPLRQAGMRIHGMPAGGLAAWSFDVLFQVRLTPSRLHVGAPIAGGPGARCFMQRVEYAMDPTLGDCAISQRTVRNNAGRTHISRSCSTSLGCLRLVQTSAPHFPGTRSYAIVLVMIAAGLFMFVLVMGFIVLDWWYFTQRRSDATRYGCRVAAVVQQVPMPSASELAARFHPSGLLPLPHGAARFFPNERRMVLHPDCRRFASRFRTAWPMKGSIDVSSAEDGLQLVCIKRIPWSSAIVTLLWFALVGLGTTGFVISFLLQGGFESLSGIVMGLGVMGLGALVFIFGLVTVSLAYHLENTRLMQVWEELRQALRGPATEDETGLV